MNSIISNGKELLFVKLGGSAITKKEGDFETNSEVLTRLANELKDVYDNFNIVLGHGSGSFGHKVAEKYKVKEGLCDEDGFKKIHRAALELNSIVVGSLKEAGVPVVSVHSLSEIMTKSELIELPEKIIKILENGKIPIVYGDVIFNGGYSIYSTEMIFLFLAKEIKPKRIIIGTNVNGVFNGDPDEADSLLIKEISDDNINEVMLNVSGSKVTDVTGGMADKVLKMHELAKLGPEVQIINLLKEDYLKRALKGEIIGTIIK